MHEIRKKNVIYEAVFFFSRHLPILSWCEHACHLKVFFHNIACSLIANKWHGMLHSSFQTWKVIFTPTVYDVFCSFFHAIVYVCESCFHVFNLFDVIVQNPNLREIFWSSLMLFVRKLTLFLNIYTRDFSRFLLLLCIKFWEGRINSEVGRNNSFLGTK